MTTQDMNIARRRQRLVVLFLLLGVLLASGSSGSSAPAAPKPADFSVSVSPGVNHVYRGWADTWQVTVKPLNGFTGNVDLTTVGLPAGATAIWTRTTIPGGNGTASLIVNTTTAAAIKNTDFTITGTSGSLSDNADPRPKLEVKAFPDKYSTLTLTPAGTGPSTATFNVTVNRFGLNEKVKFAVPTDLPAGVTASLSPVETSGNSTVLTFTSTGGPVPNFPFTVSGTSGKYNIDVYSQSFVGPGPAAKLKFGTQPSVGQIIQATGSGSFPVSVRVEDAGGNLTADSGRQVTLAIDNNPSAGVLTCSGGLIATTSAGVASFSGCAITKAGNGYSLKASSSPVLTPPANANSFNIIAGAANRLAWVTQPSNANTNTAIAPAPVVQVQDQYGNPLTGDSGRTVTLARVSGPTVGITGVSASTAGGLATYSSLKFDAAGIYTIKAQSLGLTDSPASVSFTITNPAQPYTISGNVPLPLRPGAAAQVIPIAFNSLNAGNGGSGVNGTQVTNLAITIQTVVGNGGGPVPCSALDFQITPVGAGAYPFYVPFGISTLASLISAGDMPMIQMIDRPLNQDDCKGATVNLQYAGTP